MAGRDERRWSERRTVEFGVTLTATGQCAQAAICRDLGIGGMYVAVETQSLQLKVRVQERGAGLPAARPCNEVLAVREYYDDVSLLTRFRSSANTLVSRHLVSHRHASQDGTPMATRTEGTNNQAFDRTGHCD
jgi:hypothetical protein